MKKVLLGDIALESGNIQDTKEIWNTIPKDVWLGCYEVGERYYRLNEYEKAIEHIAEKNGFRYEGENGGCDVYRYRSH